MRDIGVLLIENGRRERSCKVSLYSPGMKKCHCDCAMKDAAARDNNKSIIFHFMMVCSFGMNSSRNVQQGMALCGEMGVAVKELNIYCPSV